MTLKDLKLKYSYDSDDCDILNDFYIPALSNATSYKRIAGYFSSNSLAVAALGLSQFIKNGGRIQLISNIVLSREDYQKIKEISDEKFLENAENEFIKSLDQIEDELVKDHIKMLGWLLKNNHLEMKVALVKNGIYHQKIGVLEDTEGNVVSFSGSDNETKNGWLDNIEEFHVFCSWRSEEHQHIVDNVERFEKFWNNEAKRTKVIPISEAIKSKLIRIAPENNAEFEKLSEDIARKLLETCKRKESLENTPIPSIGTKNIVPINNLILRDYQKQAIDAWFDNNGKGFFRMATGTGKTETAIGLVYQLIERKKPVLIIIVAQGQSLVDQWIIKLKSYGLSSRGASSNPSHSNWQKELATKIVGISCGYEDYSIFVTTYQTFSSEKFIALVNKINSNSLIICDEVHHAGAPEFREGLIEKYKYRLGLSATPERWLDDEGSKYIDSYFGKVVFSFSMQRAMHDINPSTGKPFLCPYKYYPSLVNLTSEENEEYLKLTKEIGRRYNFNKNKDSDDSALKMLIFRRASIKNNAMLKLTELEKIFINLGDSLNFCIIYCSGKQMSEVKKMLNRARRIYHEFTQYLTPEQRDDILRKFEQGRAAGGYDVLLAIDCLNEGMDLPSAKIGIFLENSQNPIEFIQRRGRLLRPSPGKSEAIFFDFIVIPNFKGLDPNYQEIEGKEIQKEFDRFMEFAHLSENTYESLKKMQNIVSLYNLVINIETEEDVL
jgi:superfamily II DNA or RNA helicase